MAKVSIIVPTYNMGRWLPEALESIASNIYCDFEALVMDDGSKDDTVDVVQGFLKDQRFRYFYQENAGKSVAVNRAFRELSGEYVTVLDADDCLLTDGIADRVRVFETGPSVDLVVGGFEVFVEGPTLGTRIPPAGRTADQLVYQLLCGYKTPFSMTGCLFTKDLMLRVGLFDVGLRRAQDVDFSVRLLRMAAQFAIVPKPVFRVRKHRARVRDRLRVRHKTFSAQLQVIDSNMSGLARVYAKALAVFFQIGKALYEVRGAYLG
ncbi:MAG: glycosyltransferase [Bradymonadales bacterium]|nr:MAG: glycosyltransferase [Bradymonadales bacterium]